MRALRPVARARPGGDCRPRAIAAVLTALLLACAASAGWAGNLACGDERDGWAVTPLPVLGHVLIHLSAEGAPGAARQVRPIPRPPLLMASSEGRVVMLFAPEEAGSAPVGLWPLREVLIDRSRGTGPAMRFGDPRPLPPLITPERPIGLAKHGRNAAALCDAGAKGEGARYSVHFLEGNEWRRLPPPPIAEGGPSPRLVSLSGRAAVLHAGAEGNAARLSILDGFDEEGAPRWDTQPIAPVPAGSLLLGIAGQLVVVSAANAEDHSADADPGPTADDRWAVGLVRAGSIQRIASIPRQRGEERFVPVGSRLVQVWPSDPPGARLHARVLTLGGAIVHDGPAGASGLIGRIDIALMAVALGALLATVLVFVFRPESARIDAVRLPPNTALANAPRRLIAGMADALTAYAFAALVWRVPAGRHLTIGDFLSGEHGLAPLLTAMALAIIVCAVGEARWGRTPGKLLTGCRTVSADGRPLSVRQALARNFTRVLCPPLGLLWMLQSPQRQGGLFGTVVVIDLPPETPETPDGSGPPPGGGGTDGRQDRGGD